jgi:transcriptional regulator with XRE-family HTH domain
MTPFGKYMRNIRTEKGLLLKDVADMLQVTSAYLSAVEHGKKSAPSAAFVSKLENVLRLDTEQRKGLRRAARDSLNSVDIPSKSTPFAFETANAFARKLPSLSEDQLRRIKSIVDQEKDE